MRSSATNLNNAYLHDCFFFKSFSFSFLHKLWIFKWEMSNDKAKVAKGDNLSRNITMAALNVHHRFRCVAGIERIWVLWRRLYHFIHVPDHEYFFDNGVGVCSKGENFIVANLSFTHVIVRVLGHNCTSVVFIIQICSCAFLITENWSEEMIGRNLSLNNGQILSFETS